MAEAQMLRLLVSERLAAAAEEIFGLLQKTVAEYQEEAARCRGEVVRLKKQLEQLTVLKTEVVLTRTDVQSVSEGILAPRQPDKLHTEEKNEPHDSQHVKEEQVDVCIVPQQTGDDVNVELPESDTTTQTDCQLIPTFSTVTVTLNDDDDDGEEEGEEDEWTEIDGLSPRGPSHIKPAFPKRDRAQKDKKTCRVCGKKFYKDCELIRHMEDIHIGEKAFKCPGCDKEFARRDHLAVHFRTHTGEKPHKCPVCKKSFTQSSNLNVHLRMHTGEKPYFCQSCGKMVAHSNHLRTCAMGDVKGEKSFRCPVCGKKFYTDSKLEVHKKIHESRIHKYYAIV